MRTLALSALLLLGHIASAEYRVAVIDMNKAIIETADGKKAKKELDSAFEQARKEVAKMESALQMMNDDFKKKTSVLSEEAKTKMQNDLNDRMAKYQALVNSSQSTLQKKQKDLLEPIAHKMEKVISAISRRENFNMVLNKNVQQIPYVQTELDLTEKAVKEYDSSKS